MSNAKAKAKLKSVEREEEKKETLFYDIKKDVNNITTVNQ